MKVVIDHCGHGADISVYEEADGVNPPRCIKLAVQKVGINTQESKLTFQVSGGGDPIYDADEEEEFLPTLAEGEVR